MIERSRWLHAISAWVLLGLGTYVLVMLGAMFWRPLGANLSEIGQLGASNRHMRSGLSATMEEMIDTPGLRLEAGSGEVLLRDQVEEQMMAFVRRQNEAGLDLRVEPAQTAPLSDRLELLTYQASVTGTKDEIERMLAALQASPYAAHSYQVRVNDPAGESLVLQMNLLAIARRASS